MVGAQGTSSTDETAGDTEPGEKDQSQAKEKRAGADSEGSDSDAALAASGGPAGLMPLSYGGWRVS